MTKRILIKLALFTAFLFALGSYMSYQITGHIPIFNKDTVQSTKQSIKNIKLPSLTTDDSNDAQQTIYMWNDANGDKHMGNNPPAGARNIKKLN